MSLLPISRSALDRLGERLAASDEISETDYELLLSVLTAYQAALDETRDRLTRLGYAPTTRVKTTSVLIEKLRRESGMKLKGVQDIAGARIVADVDRREQDAIVARIVDEFADASRAPKVKDRRAEPMAGYRAVHVIVTVQDVPVEIQVRTQRQDQWAQIAEALGDKWGRGLRYGAGPDDPERSILPGIGVTRLQLWQQVLVAGELIDSFESLIEPDLDASFYRLPRHVRYGTFVGLQIASSIRRQRRKVQDADRAVRGVVEKISEIVGGVQ